MKMTGNHASCISALPLALYLALMFITTPTCFGQMNRTDFYGEDPFRTTPITRSMLKGLSRAQDFQSCHKWRWNTAEATRVDVNGDGTAEILVKADCGNSASSFFFWLLRQNGHRYTPILHTATMGVYFWRKRHHGFRDVLTGGCNANTCFHEFFSSNGQRYIRRKQWTEPISETPSFR